MKKLIAFMFVIALAVVLALLGGVLVRKVHAQQPPVKAFQVWIHMVFKNPGDTLVHPSDEYYARRSDGTVVKKMMTQGSWMSEMDIPSRGITIRYSDKNNDTMTFGNGLPRLIRDVRPDCKDSPDLAGPIMLQDTPRNILGFDTVLSKQIHPQSETVEQTDTSWNAPALNCIPLLTETATTKNGEVVSYTTRTVTRVSLGDPPDDVFKIPTGNELPPSQFTANLGQVAPPGLLQRLEQKYNADKAAREAAGH